MVHASTKTENLDDFVSIDIESLNKMDQIHETIRLQFNGKLFLNHE